MRISTADTLYDEQSKEQRRMTLTRAQQSQIPILELSIRGRGSKRTIFKTLNSRFWSIFIARKRIVRFDRNNQREKETNFTDSSRGLLCLVVASQVTTERSIDRPTNWADPAREGRSLNRSGGRPKHLCLSLSFRQWAFRFRGTNLSLDK